MIRKEGNNIPAISIIVPIYKAEKYLADCLDSILAQTFNDFELILVNDGSPDNSGAICDAYTAKDHRVKVIHIPNGGASSARNAGVKIAKGKYLGWVDADDRIAQDMYEQLFHLAESYNADITECQYFMVNGDHIKRSGKEEPVVCGDCDFILEEFFSARMQPNLWTKIYKREIWNGIRLPEGRKHQDCYVNMRFALMHLVYVRTSMPLYYYFVRGNSITTTFTSYEIRQAIYLYDYTMNLAAFVASSDKGKKYLIKDATNRLIGRFFEVTVNANLRNQKIYNHYLRKKLGHSLIKYLLFADLPFKTRISYALVLLNQKSVQVFLHKHLGN